MDSVINLPTYSVDELMLFLNTKLHVNDIHLKLSENKLKFLNEVAFKWQQAIPFQNLNQLAREPLDRCMPNVNELLEDIFNGHGGLCVGHNLALFVILKALDFDTYLAASAVMNTNKINHFAVIIRNVETDGDIYLMDLGTGYPCFTAVSLDFSVASSEYRESFVTYKFIRDNVEDGLIKRVHLTTNGIDSAGRKFLDCDENGWATYFHLWLKEETIEHILQEIDDNVFRDLSYAFNNKLVAVKFQNEKLIAVKNNVLLTENENGNIKRREFLTGKDMETIMHENFPEIPKEIVTRAWGNCREFNFQ